MEQLLHCASASVFAYVAKEQRHMVSYLSHQWPPMRARRRMRNSGRAPRSTRDRAWKETPRKNTRRNRCARYSRTVAETKAAIGPIRQGAQHDCRQSHEQRGSDNNRGAAGVGGFASIKAGEQKTVDGVGENNPEQDRPEAEDERTHILPRSGGARIHERAARRNVRGVVGGRHPHDKHQEKKHRNVEREDDAKHPRDPSRRLAETARGHWFWEWR